MCRRAKNVKLRGPADLQERYRSAKIAPHGRRSPAPGFTGLHLRHALTGAMGCTTDPEAVPCQLRNMDARKESGTAKHERQPFSSQGALASGKEQQVRGMASRAQPKIGGHGVNGAGRDVRPRGENSRKWPLRGLGGGDSDCEATALQAHARKAQCVCRTPTDRYFSRPQHCKKGESESCSEGCGLQRRDEKRTQRLTYPGEIRQRECTLILARPEAPSTRHQFANTKIGSRIC